MSRIIYLLFLISFFIFAACSQNNTQQFKEDNHSMSLEDETRESLDVNKTNEEETIRLDEEVRPPSFGVPNEEPKKQPQLQNQTEPELDQSEDVKVKIPFKELRERWNSITSEHVTDLEISSFEEVTNEKYFKASISPSLELRVYVKNDNVDTVQLFNTNRSDSAILSMLTGWSQIVYLLDPNAQIHEIDELFHQFGIGPNLDLSKVIEKTVEHSRIQYTVKPNENEYEFVATYNEE